MSLSEIFWLPGGPWPSANMEGYMQRIAKAPVGARPERWVAAMILITAVASVGCEELLDVLDPPGQGYLDVFIQIDGDPARPVEGLRVKAVSIEAVLLRDGATEEEIITLREDPPELVVSSQSFGVPLLVARASLPVGQVKQIRVVLESALLRESGEARPLYTEVFVPSGQQTGLKAIPRHGVLVRVAEGQETRALVEVDLASQLIEPPGRGLLLKPTSDLTRLDRATVADFLGEREIVLSTVRTGVAETGVVLELAKVLNTETGVVRTIAVDGAGALRDLEEIAASERAAYRAAHGVLMPGLVTDLEGVSADRVLSLEALVAVPPTGPYQPLKLGSLQERDAHSAAYREQVSFHASAGQVVRVVLAWDACPYDAVFGPFGLPGLEDDFLTIDLDLVVQGPPEDGRTSPFLKANPSWVDNYEIVEFFVPRSGTWTIRVQAPRWRGCTDLDTDGTGARRTYYGLAWDIRELFE